MATYMIDYENVKTGGLNGISRLTSSDRVIIFYSENANRLTFDLHQRLMSSPAKIEYREVSVGGHNALDFQLVTYLGFLIAGDRDGQYMIISNDRGFEYVVNFWRKDGLQIGLFPYLKDPNYAMQRVVLTEQTEVPAESPVCEPEPEVIFTDSSEEAPAKVEEPAKAEEPAEAREPVKAEEPVKTAPVRTAKISPSTPILEEKIAPKKKPAPKAEAPVKEQPAPKQEEKASPKAEPEVPSAEEPKPAAKPAKKKSAPKKKSGSEKPAPKAETPAKEQPAEPDVNALLSGVLTDAEELAFVKASVEKYKTKQGLNNALMKKFESQKAGEIYQALKPAIRGLRGR